MLLKESSLDGLKKNYKKLQKKHSLPDFEKLNEDFQIEKLAEVETDYLIREIRKFMGEKFSNYLRFVEAILNPTNAPTFIFSIVKSIRKEEKDKLTEIYKKISILELELIELDVSFSERNEISFVKGSFEIWQGIKQDTLGIIQSVKDNWDTKSEGRNKGYFG